MVSALSVAAAAGVLAWALWTAWRGHREFASEPGTFACRVRVRSAYLPGFTERWSRRRCHARWVHDVLIIRRGLLMPRLQPLAVRVAEGELVELDPRRVRGLGSFPVSVRVLLDDRSALEIASRGRDQALLAGPFVVLAVSRRGGRTVPPDTPDRRPNP